MSLDEDHSAAVEGSAWDFATPADEFEISEEDTPRYDSPLHLHTGGMGQVESVTDNRLGRRVARKTVAPQHQSNVQAKGRLAREAWIAARLEHPNIVPIYDCGNDETGAPFYTMRLVRGQSLAECLADGGTTSHALLRPFLGVCEAMAYAHQAGIVHRDLKPANIMLDKLGEVQVVDWGLARALDLPETSWVDSMPTSSGYAATQIGAVVGTPGYMSPEQAKGESADRRSDVYGLGSILSEILTGSRDGERPADVDVSLWTIVETARAVDPAERYASAGPLAADIARYLDGRIVGAHDYTTWQLLRRAIRTYRTPLMAAVVALCIGAVAAGLAWGRALEERDRALVAEEKMRQLSIESLAEQATRALIADRRARAEGLAIRALTLGESKEARAVLSATLSSQRAKLEQHFDMPGCTRSWPIESGAMVCASDKSVALWVNGQQRWSLNIDVVRVVDLSRDGVIVLGTGSETLWRDLRTGAELHEPQQSFGGRMRARRAGPMRFIVGEREHTFVVWPGNHRRLLPCGPAAGNTQFTTPTGQIVIGCIMTGFHRYDLQAELVDVVPPLPRKLMERVIAGDVLPDGRYLLGTLDGAVFTFDPSNQRVGDPVSVGDTSIRNLIAHPTSGLALVHGSTGQVRVWDTRSEQTPLHLPEHATETRWAWSGDRLISTSATGYQSWSIPTGVLPSRIELPRGISSALRSEQATYVADGSSHIYRYDHRGAPLVTRTLDERPPMGMRQLSDGRLWLDRTAGDRAVLLSPSDLDVVRTFDSWTYRRAGELSDGTLWSWDSDRSIRVIPNDGGPSWKRIRGAPLVGLGQGPSDIVYSLDAKGMVSGGRPGLAATPLFERPGALDLHAATDAERLLIVLPEAIELVDLAGAVLCRAVAPLGISEATLAANGERIAIGTMHGSVHLWDGQCRKLAEMTGHKDRISSLWLDVDTLLTASWDGVARQWNLSVLEADKDALVSSAP